VPTIGSDRATIYYEAGGRGPAVAFAHGAGGNRLSWWQQTPHFEDGFRVIRFDHRGFGRSRCEPADFHPKHFARDLLAVLDAEGVDRAALVCQSMGGWTGLRTALEAPERVACLVLCDTPGGVVSPAILEAAAAIGRGAAREGIRGNAALAPDFPAREPALAHLYDQIAGLNTGFDPAALARMYDEEGRIAPERLAGFAVPTLIVSGALDQLFPPAALREVAALIPGAAWADFPGCGHSVYFEDAPAFNRVVRDFVRAHTQR
jgi:pimeloyl-ACP methyl ester carboxylesterase